ncbi:MULTISPECIES: DUF459 domain-containing protein [unclassified Achromobacter]|uniref:SGNH/GDSL hydrolase family protein n=1 Tax=unclassified Achromobacter TaxID=2626865 RepID=UPI00130345E2|nr:MULTISPECIES: DUF459 domain-containing protein [unclassified Achromobacter]
MASPRTQSVSTVTTLVSLVFLALASLWLMQGPIGIYYQQTYHRGYPLAVLEESEIWKSGQQIWASLNGAIDDAGKSLDADSVRLTDDANQKFVLTEDFYLREQQAKVAEENQRRAAAELLARQKQEAEASRLAAAARLRQEQAATEAATTAAKDAAREAEQAASQQALQAQQAQQAALDERSRALALAAQQGAEEQRRANYLMIAAPGKVFMAGDSLMQGIAPHLLRTLKTQYGIEGVDLSKQSTGLSYPNAFNWPETISRTILKDPGIRLLVIMLGPNDPWDMPDPANRGGKFLRFKTPEWEAVYRQRIAGIIQSNAAHGVSTLWIGAPGMKASKLDGQMLWLMQIVQDEVEKQGAVFVDTRHLLPGENVGYSDSILLDGKNTKMRSGDGIHFSVAGQKYLARQILDKLRLPQPATPQ